MKTNVLDVPIDIVTSDEALNKLLYFLSKEEKRNHLVVTPNPEMIMRAKKDTMFLNIIKEADLVIPDGIGVVLASKLNKDKLCERVAGCDLVISLLENTKKDKTTVYILGAKPGVPEKAKCNIELNYKNVKVIGYHNGYFDEEKEKIIIKDIINLKPDVLLVGLGFPRQEKWIYKYKNDLPVCISIGVGGSIDVIAGEVKRAPMIYRKLGLEWFYRLICQPKRIFRILTLPVFVGNVIIYKLFRI